LNILVPDVCEIVSSTLPVELREMVYENIADMGEDFAVGECQDRKTMEVQLFYSGRSRDWLKASNQPWYLKPVFVGDEFAQDISAAWYRRSRFWLTNGIVKVFLTTKLWGTITPKTAVRRIGLRSDEVAETKQAMDRLQSSVDSKMHITIDLGSLNDWDERSEEVLKILKDAGSRVNNLAALTHEEATTFDGIRVAESRRIKAQQDDHLLDAFTTLLPHFVSLLDKGHTVTIQGGNFGFPRWYNAHNPGWTWTPRVQEMTVANALLHWTSSFETWLAASGDGTALWELMQRRKIRTKSNPRGVY
jgi:hypothetical protein